MDLLCSESLVNDSEPSIPQLYRLKTQQQEHSNSYSSSCSSSSSASSTGACGDAEATGPAVSRAHASTNTMTEIAYVYATPQQSQQQQLQPQQPTAATATTTTTSVHRNGPNYRMHMPDYVNTAIVDPTFKSDRCLENALKAEEKHQQIIGTYFKTVQRDITPAMRKIVAEWMMEVCAEEKCQEEVVLLALNYMDRFLSTKSVRKTHLQILAAACLLLASKLREPSCRALSVDLLVVYTDNSIYKDDLIKWELYVLSRLGWDLSSVTPLDFLELLIIRLPIRSKSFPDLNIAKVRQHAQAFISLAAKEHQFAKYPASNIAASSIAASMSGLKWHLRTGHNLHFLLNLLTDLTSVEQDQLQECMLQMEAIFEEHSRKLQPFLVGIEQPQTSSVYYHSCYQSHQCQQQHVDTTATVEQQQQQCLIAAMPDLTQTCKMQAQTQVQSELPDIKF